MNEKFIKRCIELAKKGEGKVSPNPLVGAILFDDDGNILSEGFHENFGSAHAEVNAIKSFRGKTEGLNLAVNLEPCSHYGKTPPCTDLIIKSGIKKVIVGMKDPNPKVNGKGIQILKNAGMEVISGICEKECLELNEIFIKNQIEKKTFVTIKSAATIDGKISFAKDERSKITSQAAIDEVHRLRNKYDAVMTGRNTVEVDNPLLTCRMQGGRNPARIILDSNLNLTLSKNVFADNARCMVFTAIPGKLSKINKIEIISCTAKNGMPDLNEVFSILFEKGIYSVMVEAGSKLAGNIIKENLADRLIYFIAPKICSNPSAPTFAEINCEKQIELINLTSRQFPPDIMLTGLFKKV